MTDWNSRHFSGQGQTAGLRKRAGKAVAAVEKVSMYNSTQLREIERTNERTNALISIERKTKRAAPSLRTVRSIYLYRLRYRYRLPLHTRAVRLVIREISARLSRGKDRTGEAGAWQEGRRVVVRYLCTIVFASIR